MIAQWPFISSDGRVGGFVATSRGWRGGGASRAEGCYVGPLGGDPRRACPAPSCPPVLDASGRLYVAHGHRERSRISELRPERPSSGPLLLVEIEGSVEQLELDPVGRRLLALVAEPGSDGASVSAGRRLLERGGDPDLDGGFVGSRSLVVIDRDRGRAEPLLRHSGSFWEIAASPDGSVIAVYSAVSGEDGWYTSVIARVRQGSTVDVLYRPTWQVASPAVDDSTGRIAFVEAWASDRGLVAGEVVVLGPDGQVEARLDDLGVDVTSVAFARDGRVLFAGWQDLSVAWGSWSPAGRKVHVEPYGVTSAPWRPGLAFAPDASTAVACRSSETLAPEVAILEQGERWRPWCRLSSHPETELDVVEGSWEGPGGREIHGILLSPRRSAPAALVVAIHGGPTIAWHHGFDLAHANELVSEGFAVVLPNPRGSAGRGAEFARANHGDPGGAELDDVIAGAAWARRHLAASEMSWAVMGGSYGGYLSALCAVTQPLVGAAVVSAGMSDWVSCRLTCNNPTFYDVMLGGPISVQQSSDLARKRSPIYRLGARAAPTLILHGAADTCVPVSQALELFGALRSSGSTVEMAIYPREGHQQSERDHAIDSWSRSLRFLRRHLFPS